MAVRSIIGRPNASVLPEPVHALPQTSRPASASGIVSAWIGNGSVMRMVASALTSALETPRLANVADGVERVGLSSPEVWPPGCEVRVSRKIGLRS